MMSSLVAFTRKRSLSSPRNSQCLIFIVNFHFFSADLRRARLLPCPLHHHSPNVFFCGVCMLLLHCTLLGESLSVSSIMFGRMLSLSLVHILHAHLTLVRCSSLIVSGLRKPLAHARPRGLDSRHIEDEKVELQQTELNANLCRKGWMLERKRTPEGVT
jgi:hypothetical protein